MISEMKDNFRGLVKSPLAPPEIEIRAPDPEFIFDVSFSQNAYCISSNAYVTFVSALE